MEGPIAEGLTFDDVLLLPGKSRASHGSQHADARYEENSA